VLGNWRTSTLQVIAKIFTDNVKSAKKRENALFVLVKISLVDLFLVEGNGVTRP
jgi:hypothetical protein